MGGALAKKSALNERQWLDAFGKTFVDDQQGMLYAQLCDILKGNLDMDISDDHIEAYKAESKPLHKFLEEF